jgi:hypothetical protein
MPISRLISRYGVSSKLLSKITEPLISDIIPCLCGFILLPREACYVKQGRKFEDNFNIPQTPSQTIPSADEASGGGFSVQMMWIKPDLRLETRDTFPMIRQE